MIIACTILLALAAQETGTPVSQDLEKAFVEMEVLRAVGEQPLDNNAQVFQGELVYVDLTLNFEERFLEQQMLDLWRKPLDLQVELSTPWGQKSLPWLSAVHGQENGDTSLVADYQKAFVAHLPNSREGWVRFRLRRAFVMTQVGALEIPSAKMRLAWATHFEDDLVRGTIPLDRQDTTLESDSWQASVIPLPNVGAVEHFFGAVGRFTFSQEERLLSSPPHAGEGESLETPEQMELRELRLSIRGIGFLSPKMMPTINLSKGIHLRGQRIESFADGLTLVVEIQCAPSEASLPPIPWAHFDPADPAHFVSSQVKEKTPQKSQQATSPIFVVVGWLTAVIALCFGWHLLKRHLRRNTQTNRKPIGEPISPIEDTPQPHPRDLVDTLAKCLNCSREEIYSSKLRDRLVESGLAESICEELYLAVEVIVQARFAGSKEHLKEEQFQELQQRLERLENL